MKSIEKITFMHRLFGTSDGRCKECTNFRRWRVGNKTVRKCRLYGCSHSNATDWKAYFQACGRFNTPPDGEGNLYLLNRPTAPTEDRPLPGQVEMEIENGTEN